MASHDLAHQPEERLITEIAELKRQISEMRTLQAQGQSAISMAATGIASAVATGVADGAYVLFNATLVNSQSKMVFSTFQYTLYHDTPDNAHIVGVSGVKIFWWHRTDWQRMSDTFLTQGYKSPELILVKNESGSTRDIYLTCEWRYIVNGGTTSIS